MFSTYILKSLVLYNHYLKSIQKNPVYSKILKYRYFHFLQKEENDSERNGEACYKIRVVYDNIKR